LRKLWVLALNTLRENVRDRVLYSILFFAAICVCCSLIMKDITIGDQAKVVRSVAQGSIDVFGSIMAMFLGVSLVWKELEKKTVYTIVSRPIPRWMFILGKYAGLVLTIMVELFILTVVYTALLGMQQGFPPAVLYVSMATLLFELVLLTAWATLFSTMSSPTTASGFTLAIFVIGHLADDLWLFGSTSESPVFRQWAQGLYWVLPNFELFSIREQAVHERAIPWSQVGLAIGYGLAYTTAVLSAAVAVFSRKDIR